MAIKNVRVLTLQGGSDVGVSEANIWIRDDYIRDIGSDLPESADAVIDGRGMVALPGLVNAHTHAAMTLFRGVADDLPLDVWLSEKIWPMESKLTPEDSYWGVKLALVEMIRSGITGYADMYFSMDEEARAVEEAGIRASLARGLVAVQGGWDEALKEACDFNAKWNGRADGRITTMFGPHAPYTCPSENLKEVVSLAKSTNVGIHIHLSETEKEFREIKEQYGLTPVEYADAAGVFDVHTLAAHCVHLSPTDIDILARKGVFVAHNPQSNLKLGSGIAPVPRMLLRKIAVAIGTDGAASNNNLDMFEEMRTAALLHKGFLRDATVVPARQVLEMATVYGAQALGFENVGPLLPGNKADLILVDFDRPHLTPCFDCATQLVYSAAGADVDTVIVDGRIVMHHREIQTLDEEAIITEVNRRVMRLVNQT